MKFDIIKICAGLIIVLALLMYSSVATETTWRHSGFELWGYDINFTNMNATNLWVLDLEDNGIPGVSDSGSARLYYNDTDGEILVSENGNAYTSLGGGGATTCDLDMAGYNISNVRNITASFGNLDPHSPLYQVAPFNMSIATAGNYSVNGSGNNFHTSSWVKNYGSQNTVAVFGSGIAENSYSEVWGGNFVGYANSSGATGIGAEVNFGSMASGGNAYGLVIASAGDYATDNSLQFQSNTDASRPFSNIYFNSGGGVQPATHSLIATSSNLTVPVGLNFTDAEFSSEIAIALGQNHTITASNSANIDTQILKLDTNDVLWIGSGTFGRIDMVIIPATSGSLRIGDLAHSGPDRYVYVDCDGNLRTGAVV